MPPLHGVPFTAKGNIDLAVIFYDHRCNGRSQGAPVSSMTFENLTADADALGRRLGYERRTRPGGQWTVWPRTFASRRIGQALV